MSHLHTSSLNGARIDVHDAFQLVCWARHFSVPQQWVRQAVQAVGGDAGQVASHLGLVGQRVMGVQTAAAQARPA